ncbi:gamma-glutamyltransferase family protein [Prauserella cavernicola]|uniref:Gamma-glutamyltransferase n=1 Tax=Prauserella cavernicola TaxID=2800127 RepID=A0A934QVN4_9PSEU|nr:gamma-glutamyltransferase [Prauserella cavernicola]MBK1787280.1 gamma-glutamyltransferase [Prauserella cavernicola]
MDAATRAQLTDQARFGRKQPASGRDGMAVTSHPIVTQTAVDILRGGGNAADAALGASVAQAVVEPHMTTICGVLSMLYYDAKTGETTYLNGSMNRPKELTSFLPTDLPTGKSVAVPGFWAAFEAGLERHGSKSKSELVAPAIELARDGFDVYPFLYGMAFEQIGTLGRYPGGRELFFPDGRLIEVGEPLRQPALADTLENLVSEGADYFYRGKFAQKLVDTVQRAGGVMTLEDLDEYSVRWVEPARGTYRGYDVVASPPPDTGGTHVIEILNLLELIPLAEWGPPTDSADTLYWMLRFCGEVFDDGGRLRDPEFFDVPLDLLVSKEYARQRFELMKMSAPRPAPTAQYPGSNHVTVVDGEGNVASILHSVMSLPWTNGLYVDGVQLWAGAAHFLRMLPPAGGRGTCYVAPTIIFKDGAPVLTAGSPSVGLIQNIVQNTVNLLDFGVGIEESVHRPRFGGPSLATMINPAAPPGYYIESDIDESLRDEVASRGVALDVCNPWNFHSGSYEGVHIADDGTMSACADPRRAGKALAV